MKNDDWGRRSCKDQEEQNSENAEPSVVVTNLGFFTEKKKQQQQTNDSLLSAC